MLPLVALSLLLFARQEPQIYRGPWDGSLVQSDGKPISHASVYLIGHEKETRDVVLSTTTTDDAGQYHLDAASANVTFPRTVAFQAKGYGWAFTRAYSTPFVGKVTALPESLVKVKFLGADGKPIANLKVHPVLIQPTSGSAEDFPLYLWLPDGLAAQNEFTTDATGTVEILGVAANHKLRLDTNDDRFTRLSYRTTFTVGPQEATPEIKLIKGASVEGVLTGLDGKPAAGYEVSIQAQRAEGWGSCTTSADGKFLIKRLPPDVYNLSLSLSEEQNKTVTAVAKEVNLDEAEAKKGLALKLEEGGLVSGVLKDATGKPWAAQMIGIYGPAHPRSGAHVQSVRTDTNGRFVARVPAGKQHVYISSAADFLVGKDIEVQTGKTTEFELQLPAPAVPKVYKGHVVDSEGKPVAGAIVHYNVSCINDQDIWSKTTTGEDGSYTFTTIGNVTDPIVRAKKDSSATLKEIKARESADNLITLEKDGLSSLTGLVTNLVGKPISGASVRLTIWSGQMGRSNQVVITDQKGIYHFEGIYRSVEFDCMAKATGFGGKDSGRLIINKKDCTVPTIKLAVADSFVSGRVIDENDKPVSGAEVFLGASTDNIETSTDKDGRFRVSSLEKGKHPVSIVHGHSYLSRSIEAGKDVVLVLNSKTDMTVRNEGPSDPLELIGKPAPELQTTQWLNSKPLSLKSLKGRVVVIDFWAVWCGPCKQILPKVKTLASHLKGMPVTVIGLHDSSTWKKELTAFAKENGLSYPLGVDTAGGSGFGKTMAAYRVSGIPTLAVIDQNGKLVAFPESVEKAEEVVKKLLKRSAE